MTKCEHAHEYSVQELNAAYAAEAEHLQDKRPLLLRGANYNEIEIKSYICTLADR